MKKMNIKDIQSISLEIMKDIHEFCQKMTLSILCMEELL